MISLQVQEILSIPGINYLEHGYIENPVYKISLPGSSACVECIKRKVLPKDNKVIFRGSIMKSLENYLHIMGLYNKQQMNTSFQFC